VWQVRRRDWFQRWVEVAAVAVRFFSVGHAHGKEEWTVQ